ncbi:hypothetical protein M422DRAFT_277150 [Sphaerobolus stellatus SS14]|uniref:F-box domain-containing protein n=1 Tax=Sphaerobolus stellatus (strain SS14) TaxID=990650 RepID=A0A0C9UBF2_SPHS4|nr:hypothetical protein M422DRAFT_277150 [Sphaerobolus stellatus SS14]
MDVQRSGCRTQEKRQRMQSKVKDIKSKLSPIHRIPTELLVYIFELASKVRFEDLPDYHSSWRMDGDRYGCITLKTSPFVFLHVCNKWRRVMPDTPTPFSQPILTVGYSFDPSKILPMWLKQLKRVRLDVHINADRWQALEEFETIPDPWQLGIPTPLIS